MDPLYESKPTSTGSLEVEPGVTLYYELRGSPSASKKIALIMGSLATCRHYEFLADYLASIPSESGEGVFQVLNYDHRGVGKSKITATKPPPQTSDLLAQDMITLVDHVWPLSRFHVYGASMGGMIAQKVAVKLGGTDRLGSVYFSVTARGYGLSKYIGIPKGFYKFVLPMVIHSQREKMIATIVEDGFPKEYLDSVHQKTGKTMREMWTRKWTDEYEQWYCFHDLDACAEQSALVGKHWLTDDQVSFILASKTPMSIMIANGDKIMPPKSQHELARILQISNVRETEGGHLATTNEEQAASFEHISKHFLSCS